MTSLSLITIFRSFGTLLPKHLRLEVASDIFAQSDARSRLAGARMKEFLEPLESRKRHLNALANSLKSLMAKRDGLQDALADHKNFDPQQCAVEVSQLHSVRDQISDTLGQLETALRDESAEMQRLGSETVSLFNIVTFFSADQKLLRSKVKALAARVSSSQTNVKHLKDERNSTIQLIEQKSRKIVEFREFDETASETELRRVVSEMELAQNNMTHLETEIASVNVKVGSLVAEYEGLQAKIRVLMTTISAADGLDRDLSDANNSYERSQIHAECETRFGDGSPRKVRSDASRELRSIENNLPKLERRIRDELKKFEMVMSHIIIDGNNTCYDRKGFIRLHALTHLVDELTRKYKVTVVFDASIRSLMRTDDAGIERIIGQSAAIHVAPTKTGADEYILRLAEGRPHSYIMSNDRFGEFGDYDAVRSGRLLRFMIADNRIMVNDLDIDISLRS